MNRIFIKKKNNKKKKSNEKNINIIKTCVKSIAIVLDSSFRDEYQYAIDGNDRIM